MRARGRLLAGVCLLLAMMSFTALGCRYRGEGGVSADELSGPIPWPEGFDPREYFPPVPLDEGPEVFREGPGGGRWEQELRFPGYRAQFTVSAGAERDAPVPGVVILPISKGDSQALAVADYLAAHGFACLRMITPREILAVGGSTDAVEEFRSRFRTYVAAVLTGVDWLAARPGIDPERLGLVGISFGAIAGVVVTGAEPRIRAAALLLGGGDLSGIFLSSEEGLVVRLRERMAETEGVSGPELGRRLWDELLPVEPLLYAPRVDPARVLLVNAVFDRVIRRRHTLALWVALGRPRLYMVPAGHYSAIAFLPYANRLTLLHLQGSLAPSGRLRGSGARGRRSDPSPRWGPGRKPRRRELRTPAFAGVTKKPVGLPHRSSRLWPCPDKLDGTRPGTLHQVMARGRARRPAHDGAAKNTALPPIKKLTFLESPLPPGEGPAPGWGACRAAHDGRERPGVRATGPPPIGVSSLGVPEGHGQLSPRG